MCSRSAVKIGRPLISRRRIGEQRFQNRQSERNHRDGHGHERRRFLRSRQSQRAEHETDEQAARVTQENRGRIEVEAKESQDGAGEGHAHQGVQPGMIDQGDDKKHHRRKQGRSGGQTIQAIDQIEGVGDRNHPQHREGQPDKPGQRVVEDQRQIENAHSTGEEHGSGDRLHGKLQIRTCAAEIIVDAKTKNQAGGNIDTEKRGRSESIDQAGKYEGEPQPHAQADRESQENRHAPQTGKRGLVDMPSVLRRGNPASAGCHVSHFTCRHKRHETARTQIKQRTGASKSEFPSG